MCFKNIFVFKTHRIANIVLLLLLLLLLLLFLLLFIIIIIIIIIIIVIIIVQSILYVLHLYVLICIRLAACITLNIFFVST